jgi:SAM-dependent methyltransferase
MNQFLYGVTKAIAEAFDLPGPAYEIGAYQVEGQEDLCNLRGCFAGKPYKGLDMRAGPGVDIVADVQKLDLPDRSVGTFVAMSTFEHVPEFWKGFAEMERVLRGDGAALISCPFNFYIHNYPGDYWRFTPQAMELLLGRFGRKIVGWEGQKKRPAHVWALAFGNEHPAIKPEQLERYASLLNQYAREPADPWREMRYRLARGLCGRGPFASFLDRNQWETQFQDASKSPDQWWRVRSNR